MKYVIAGKKQTYTKYLDRNNLKSDSSIIYARTKNIFNQIKKEDSILLLPGWWGRSWAEEAIEIVLMFFPSINIEYLDGPFGEEHRINVKNSHDKNKSVTRFDLIDLD